MCFWTTDVQFLILAICHSDFAPITAGLQHISRAEENGNPKSRCLCCCHISFLSYVACSKKRSCSVFTLQASLMGILGCVTYWRNTVSMRFNIYFLLSSNLTYQIKARRHPRKLNAFRFVIRPSCTISSSNRRVLSEILFLMPSP